MAHKSSITKLIPHKLKLDGFLLFSLTVKCIKFAVTIQNYGTPKENRIPIPTLSGLCLQPLDDGCKNITNFSLYKLGLNQLFGADNWDRTNA